MSKEEAENTVIDKDPRKIFIVQEGIKDKPLQLSSIGKSGFVLAVGEVITEQQNISQLNNPITEEVNYSIP